MFYLRTRKNSAAETAQEPSSPKVTCFGQVRPKATTADRRRRFSLLRKIGGSLSSHLRARGMIFRNCGFLPKSCDCSRPDATVDSIADYSEQTKTNQPPENIADGDQGGNRFRGNDGEIAVPRNALILTRCRSAPYRSLSLGDRFWDSQPSEDEDKAKSEELHKGGGGGDESAVRVELGNSVNGVEGLDVIGCGAVHPLLLMRSKSVPARTAERLKSRRQFVEANKAHCYF